MSNPYHFENDFNTLNDYSKFESGRSNSKGRSQSRGRQLSGKSRGRQLSGKSQTFAMEQLNDKSKSPFQNDLVLSNLYQDIIQSEQKQFKHMMRQTESNNAHKVLDLVDKTLKKRDDEKKRQVQQRRHDYHQSVTKQLHRQVIDKLSTKVKQQSKSISCLRNEKQGIILKNKEVSTNYTQTLVHMHKQIHSGLKAQYSLSIKTLEQRIQKLEKENKELSKHKENLILRDEQLNQAQAKIEELQV